MSNSVDTEAPEAVAVVPLPPKPMPGRHTKEAAHGREHLLHRELVRDRLAEGTGSIRADMQTPPARVPFFTRWRRRAANMLLGALVACVVTFVTAMGATTGPIRFDDEGTYVSQALAVLHGSLSPYTYWYDHPPLGWIVVAGWMGTFGKILAGSNPIATARLFMVVLNFITTVALVMLVRRLGGSRVAAVAAGLLFGLSPLAIQYHRMVMLDNIAVTFLIVGWLFAATTSKRLTAAALAGVCLAGAVLTKETLLLTAPFMAWMAWRSYVGPTRKMSVAAFFLTFILGSSFYPLFALTRGELLPGAGHVSLSKGIYFQLIQREGSGSVFDPNSDAHTVFTNWTASDGYLLAFGALFLIPALINRRVRPVAAAALLSGATIFRGGYLPVPYVIVLLPFAAVVGCLGLETIIRFLGRPLLAGRGARGSAPMILKVGSGLALVALVGGLISFVPAGARNWQIRDNVYMRHDFDYPTREASNWIAGHTSPRDVVVADNVTWTDLVDGATHRPISSTVWFTKFKDPAVNKHIKKWQDIDYVVASQIIRTGTQPPTLSEAIEHSKIVKAWGQGSERVEIRRVRAG